MSTKNNDTPRPDDMPRAGARARRGLRLATVTVTVLALGFFGSTWAKADPSTVPDPPSITGVTQGQNAVVVDITPNSDGGDAIVSYTVDCTSSDFGAPQSNTVASSPVTVGSLTNGATYSCTAIATNGVGDSDPSDPSDDFEAITVPSHPSIDTVTLGSSSASIAFTPPADGGDAIVFYKVTCVSSTGGTTRSKTGAASPLNVTGLSNGKTYTCTLTATNSVGVSPASDPSDPFTAGTSPPKPSVSIARGTNSAIVTVTPNGNGGNAITTYSASCASSDGGASQSNSGGTSPVTVGSLTNSKTYTCTATVTNAFGTSPPSDASSSFVAATVPDAPTIGSVTRGSNSASVAFTANGTGSDPITSFTASCASSDGGTTRNATGGASPLSVGSLTNSKTYTCTVVATNLIGDGASSSASSAFEAASAPTAPSVNSVTRGNNSGIVDFTTPANNGDGITGYDASCASSDGGTTQSASGASSPITVASLTNGKTYTCTVTATNHIGTSAASAASNSFVVAAVPDPPDISSQTRVDNGVIIAFTAQSDGGDAIIDYTVSCDSIDGGGPQSNTDVASPIEVDGLTNSKTYTCTVAARNSIGTGAPSDDFGSFIAATVPDAPTIGSVTRGQNSATVSFTANGNEGDAITSYTVTCTSSNGGTTRSASNGSSPITVNSLTNVKSYTCAAAATNSFGDSAASGNTSSFVAATVPSAPTVTGKTLGSNSASVQFSANGNGGDAVTSFTATCTSSDGGATESNSGASSPISVTSLTNGKTYTCTVVATNGIGDSAASNQTVSFVDAGVADAPSITAVDLTSTGVSVSFTTPNANGSGITGYTVTCTSPDDLSPETGTDVTSPIAVTTLVPGDTYTCTVHATNGLGDSAESTATGSFSADGAPAAPTLNSVTRSGNGAVVAFTANGDGGETISDYRATCTSSNGGISRSQTGTSSPITVSSLTNGRTYTCKALATNGVGDGAWSTASSSFVAAAAPAAPTIGVATRGSNSASVAFTVNSDGGDAITGFTVSCASSDGGATESNSGTSSPIVVSSLTNSKTYTCTAVATNGVGDSPASGATGSFVAASSPAAPTIGAVTQGSNSASVAFTVNSDGGDTITGFTATCTSSDGGATESNTGASSPIVVSTLTNAKTYTCAVYATNTFGDSSSSAASTAFVAGTVPAAPTIGVVTRGANSGSVAFTANGTGGTAITGFTATCTSSDGGATESNTGASSPIVVSTLTNGKTYTCNVVATNAVGNSSASADSASFVAATLPSGAAVSSVIRGPNSASVAITANANGDAITGYNVTCTSTNGGATQSGSGATSPVTVSTLTNLKTYTCTATATNTFGTSPASAASSSFVAANVPTVPTISSITHTSGSATVNFTASSSNGGSALTGYTVTCTSSNGGGTHTATRTVTPLTVTGLTSGKSYTCRMVATNAIGDSAQSNAVTFTD